MPPPFPPSGIQGGICAAALTSVTPLSVLPKPSGVFALAAGLVLLVVVALAVPAILRIRERPAFAAAGLVIAGAELVLVVAALSLLHALTAPGILVAELALAAGVILVWWIRGRPRPPGPWRLPGRAALLAAARAHPSVATLVALAAGVLALQFVLALAIAPNNLDGLTYHLSRIAYWLQYDSALHYPGGTQRQLLAPPNGEMIQAWTIALAGVDLFAQLVQWTFLVGLGLLVYLGTRLLGLARAAAVFAASLYVVLPQPILQAATVQNDLIVAFFVGAGALFGLRGLRDRSRGDLVVAGVAAGLAVGTKGTALLAAPAIGLLVLAALWAYRPPVRLVAFGAGAVVAGLLVFASFGLAQNIANEGTLFGSITRVTDRESRLPENTLRIAWHVVDFPGIGIEALERVPREPLQAVFGDISVPPCPTCVSAKRASWFSFEVDTSANEDTSGLGPVGLFLFVPLILVMVVSRRTPRKRRVLAFAAVLSFVTFVLVLEWGPWSPRVANPLIALAAPLLGVLALRPRLAWVAVGLAVLGLVPSLFNQRNKPLRSTEPSLNVLLLGRVQQQAKARPDVANILRFLGRQVAPGEAIGLVGSEETLDYPLFGPRFERRVVRFAEPEDATYARMARGGLAGMLFSDVGPPPPGLRAIKIPRSRSYWVPAPGRS